MNTVAVSVYVKQKILVSYQNCRGIYLGKWIALPHG